MEQLVTSGQDLVVEQLDRSYGGRRKTVLRVSCSDGSVAYTTDVAIQGKLVVNGVTITGTGAGGSMVTEILGRPLKLSNAPNGDVGLFVNGQLQRTTDYAVNSDGSVSWNSPDFQLAPSDLVEAMYQI